MGLGALAAVVGCGLVTALAPEPSRSGRRPGWGSLTETPMTRSVIPARIITYSCLRVATTVSLEGDRVRRMSVGGGPDPRLGPAEAILDEPARPLRPGAEHDRAAGPVGGAPVEDGLDRGGVVGPAG